MAEEGYKFCSYARNWDTHKFSGEQITPVELTENMNKGLWGEKHPVYAFNKLGIPISHTDFNHYERGSGCDIWNHELGIYGEVKNTAPTYKFTDEFFNKKILSRFPKKARFKFLAIPSIFNLQKEHIEILKREKIRIIEFGKQVTEWSNQVAQTLIKKLYYIKLRVKNVLNKTPFNKPVPVLYKYKSDINNLEYNGLNNIIDYNVNEFNTNLDLIRTKIDQTNLLEYNRLDVNINEPELIENNYDISWFNINYNDRKPARELSAVQNWSGLLC